jgi:hypothetical protein
MASETGLPNFYDVEDLEDTASAGFIDLNTEKERLLITTEKTPISRRRYLPSRYISKAVVVFAVITVSCIAVVWVLRDCSPTIRLHHQNLAPSTFRLVKDAVSASTSGVTVDFQVYQPVFTPSGATDDTTQSDGSENTTVVAQTNATSSCQVLLMQHTFAFSYGLPFVG